MIDTIKKRHKLGALAAIWAAAWGTLNLLGGEYFWGVINLSLACALIGMAIFFERQFQARDARMDALMKEREEVFRAAGLPPEQMGDTMTKTEETRVEIGGQEVKPNLRQRLGLWMMHRGTHLLAGPHPKPAVVQTWVGGAPRPESVYVVTNAFTGEGPGSLGCYSQAFHTYEDAEKYVLECIEPIDEHDHKRFERRRGDVWAHEGDDYEETYTITATRVI